MKILIATGLGGGDIGGPFQYGPRLKEEFEKSGHKVRVVKYSSIESALFRIWPHVFWSDSVLSLDTFSVGFPAVLSAKVFGKKVVMRVGGDFVWSAYANRTNSPVSLPAFYESMPKLSFKEKIIFSLNRWAIKNSFLAFNTEYQRKIWSKFYNIESSSKVVRNYIPEMRESYGFGSGKFLWAGRLIPEKNPEMLKSQGVEILTGVSHQEVLERIKGSRAVVSLAFTDICPNFILEGISWSKPFIMTRETGLVELFPKGGIFVDPTNELEIRNAMEMLSQDSVYNKCVDELRSINLNHSWAQVAEEFLNIWSKI